MPEDIRTIAVPYETFAAIEEVGQELLRAGDVRATKLLSACLSWKHAKPSIFSPAFFCDPDESSGLAEVHQLDTHSRKV